MPTHYEPTIALASKALKVHPATFKDYLSQGAPAKGPKGYDIEAIEQWRRVNRPRSKAIDDSGGSVNEYTERLSKAKLGKAEAEERKFKAEAELKEYAVRELQGDLCYKIDVANVLADMLRELRNELGKIPGQLAAGFQADLKRQIEEDCRERISISLRAAHSRLQKYLDP